MHNGRETRQQLLDFLDSKVLDPILEALPEQYSSERDRKMLQEVKMKIADEKAFFHKNDLSPEQIREQYFRELYFEVNGKIGKELEDLELPRLRQLRDQFLCLCKELQMR
jgi:hypothetical protein